MNSLDHHHVWIVGGASLDRAATSDRLPAAPVLASISAHRRLCGPYTAAGTLVRVLAATPASPWRDALVRHRSEVLAVAPELAEGAAPETSDHARPAGWTRGVAHGLTELLLDGLPAASIRQQLVVEHVDEVDPTDAEFLAVLLRRVSPLRCTLVLRGSSVQVPEPLAEALDSHAVRIDIASDAPTRRRAATDGLAAAYVVSDCTSDDPFERAAYEGAPSDQRKWLHDERAVTLERQGQPSLELGAIAFHRERGSDPKAAIDALFHAVERCTARGFHHAAVDLAERCLALLDWDVDPWRCWTVTSQLCTTLAALDRSDDAAARYDDACAQTALPTIHIEAAHGRAMLLAASSAGRDDLRRAKAWCNTALALATLLPDEDERAMQVTFAENTLAVVEMRLGNPYEALRLVTAGLQRLATRIPAAPPSHVQLLLRHHRARLLAALDQPEMAIREYTRCLVATPDSAELYVERAALHRWIGDGDAALADLDRAIRTGPPAARPHLERAELLLEEGALDAAHHAFGYVVELDPTCVAAHVQRAATGYELGRLTAAALDVDAGLRLDPANTELHCLRGLVAAARGESDTAEQAFRTAVRLDDTVVAAWCGLAALAFDADDVDAAATHLTRALAITDDPAIRRNRALAHERAGRWENAYHDYVAALAALGDGDASELLAGRARCERAIAGDTPSFAEPCGR